MSSIANLSSAPPALPAVNVHPHGHKRGSHVESTADSGSDTAAQVPAGAAQNLFGSLLQSLEQVIGLQPGTATPAPVTAASAAATPGTAAAAGSAGIPAGTAAGAPSAQSAGSLLQNYLNNRSQNLKSNGPNVSLNV